MPSLAVKLSTAMRYSPWWLAKTLAVALRCVKPEPRMIIDRIEPIALRIPGPRDPLCLTIARVTTRAGVEGYGECLSLRPPMQRALFATIRDAIAPHYLGKSVDQVLSDLRDTVGPAPSPEDLAHRTALLARARRIVAELAAEAARRRAANARAGDGEPRQDDGAHAEAGRGGAGERRRRGEGARAPARGRRGIASRHPGAMPYVADCNNAHTLAEVCRDE
jgi:hypothetical protein